MQAKISNMSFKKKKILNMFYEILIMAHETLKKINGT